MQLSKTAYSIISSATLPLLSLSCFFFHEHPTSFAKKNKGGGRRARPRPRACVQRACVGACVRLERPRRVLVTVPWRPLAQGRLIRRLAGVSIFTFSYFSLDYVTLSTRHVKAKCAFCMNFLVPCTHFLCSNHLPVVFTQPLSVGAAQDRSRLRRRRPSVHGHAARRARGVLPPQLLLLLGRPPQRSRPLGGCVGGSKSVRARRLLHQEAVRRQRFAAEQIGGRSPRTR